MNIAALIVDDQLDMQMLIRLTLEFANDGLTVSRTVSSGAEALDVIEEVDPTVVVLDEMMPGLSGVETATWIRRSRPHQRIVLCSAYIDESVRDRAALAGIRACVPKDHLAELPDTLRRVAAND